MSGVNYPYRYQYEHVAASQSLQVLGGTGAAGDYVHRLVCTVSTSATAQVQIKDGTGTTHTLLPNSPGGGIGVYNIELNAVSRLGAWQVTTGAGVEVLAIGVFSA
jgi:hypothetical protein